MPRERYGERYAGSSSKASAFAGKYRSPIADFLCPQTKLIIELDGSQHAEQSDYDAARTIALASLGCRVLRYWNNDVLARTDAVLEDIHSHLIKGNSNNKSTPPQPSPSLREREGAKGNGESV